MIPAYLSGALIFVHGDNLAVSGTGFLACHLFSFAFQKRQAGKPVPQNQTDQAYMRMQFAIDQIYAMTVTASDWRRAGSV